MGSPCVPSPLPCCPTHGRPWGTALGISSELLSYLPSFRFQVGSSSEAKLALALILTSLNTIFSSQQQQEALPDETEVVEETVAEVSEVRRCPDPRPSVPTSFPWGN